MRITRSPFAKRKDPAAATAWFTRNTRVASMQDQPMMGVLAKLLRYDFE